MSKDTKHGGRRPKNKGRKPIPLEERSRYDVWSRTQSDTFRWKVTELLRARRGADAVSERSPYLHFLTLPEPDWDGSDVSKSMSLVQERALFSKDEDMQSPIDKEAAALSSFLEFEARCRSTNDAILSSELTVDNRDAACILHYAQRKIAQILGKAPRIRDLQLSFGPGAAVTCRKKTSARFKLSTPPSIGKPALPIVFQLREQVRRWYDLFEEVHVVSGRLEFVTKNFKTYRSIVIGPSLTGMAQRAVGSTMKQLMLQSGIDLYRGQTFQRARALTASLTGADGTLDLRGGSDTNAYLLIQELFPNDWFELMDSLRDDRVVYRGKIIALEKFSSMGNGYTFELESLLFYALSYGIAMHYGIPFHKHTVTVYGDDIIAPCELCEKIIDCFPWFGLIINLEKSFIKGNFRESCGGDYYLGTDVRPFFIRERLSHHKLVCMYNHFMRKPNQDTDRKIRDLILSVLPRQFQIFGPDGFGDGHLISGAPFTTYATPHRRSDGWAGYTFGTFVEVPLRDKTPMPGDVLLPGYVIGLRDDHSTFFKWNVELLRGPFRDAFIRQFLEEHGTPLDHYVLRKAKGVRVRAKKVRVYICNDSPGLQDPAVNVMA